MVSMLPKNIWFERLRNHGGDLLRILFCGVLILMAMAGRALSAEALPPADLLKALRTKDAQFDNVKLDYITFGETTVEPFPAWKYPAIAKEYRWENEKPQVVRFRYNENLIVRGRNVIFIRNLDSSVPLKKTVRTASMVPFQKWSNTDGLAREITRNADSGRGHAIMDIHPGGLPVDIAQEQAMAIEFAHGFGFGKRIKQIDHIDQDGSQLKVEGTIQIWWEDQSRFQLVLDDHYLVREAKIESNVKGNHTLFEIRTEGTVATEGFEFAKTGSFKRTAVGKEVNGKVSGKPKVLKEFQTEFKKIQANLSDETYNTLVAMPLEPGMQVFDYVNNKTYFVGEEEKSWPLRAKPGRVKEGRP